MDEGQSHAVRDFEAFVPFGMRDATPWQYIVATCLLGSHQKSVPGGHPLKSDLRRTIITLAAAGSIIVGSPAFGHAQESAPPQAAEYAQFGSAGTVSSYAGLSFAGPRAPFDPYDEDNAEGDNGPVSENDNEYDDCEDAADNGNANDNDNAGDAGEANFLRAAVSDSATEIEVGRLAPIPISSGPEDADRRDGDGWKSRG